MINGAEYVHDAAVCDDDAATNARHSRPTNGLSPRANPTLHPRSFYPRIIGAGKLVDAGFARHGARDGRKKCRWIVRSGHEWTCVCAGTERWWRRACASRTRAGGRRELMKGEHFHTLPRNLLSQLPCRLRSRTKQKCVQFLCAPLWSCIQA